MDNGWKVQPHDLELAFSKSQKQNKILILINPDNPTGVAYSKEENEGIARVCRKHGTLVLSDEIYSLLNFDNNHCTIYKVNQIPRNYLRVVYNFIVLMCIVCTITLRQSGN